MTDLLSYLAPRLPSRPAAIPLTACRLTRPYLLERAGIPVTGTAVLFTVPYLVSEDARAAERNLSLYAVGRDYHTYICALESTLLPCLREAYPAYRFTFFADHAPLAEVETAARAGLGVVGDNGLLLTPDHGSFVFIAEICTDMDYDAVTGGTTPPDTTAPIPHCEGCGACRVACPVAATGEMCLSALTQQKGDLSDADAARLRRHDLVWGCDTCQLVCPHNRAVLSGEADTTIDYFREARITNLTPEALAAMDATAFAARAYAWRGRDVLLRNLRLHADDPPAAGI